MSGSKVGSAEAEKNVAMVVFDWAGTTVDYASSAPSHVFRDVFNQAGIYLTDEEINRPMGLEKKTHIRTLLESESGNRQWQEKKGKAWTEEDVNALYEQFEAELDRVVASYSQPIEGVVRTVEKLHGMGLKIGSTTGYNAQIMKKVIPAAARLGYAPDCVVTPDDTGVGRPSPFMIFECMRQLNVYPPCRVVKVGDTLTDIKEGKNAGAWSVGVLTGSNLLGLSEEDYQAMDEESLARRKEEKKALYLEAGADYVIDRITDLPELIGQINDRMGK